MQEIFNIYNSICAQYTDKKCLIDKLLTYFSYDHQINDNIDKFLYRNLTDNGHINPIKLFLLIGLIHQKIKENNKIANTDERKHYGVYYTDYSIARLIAQETLANTQLNKIMGYKFLEPCSGIGIFAIAYLDCIIENHKITENGIQQIVNNMFFADLDKEAISIAKKAIPLYLNRKHNVNVKINENNFYVGNVLFDTDNGILFKKNLKNIFRVKEGFDIVLTNPPYKLLKDNSNKYPEELLDSKRIPTKKLVEYIHQNRTYKYNEGTLNYYKIFIEEIISNYTNDNSKIGLLIPITLLNDKQSEKLRRKILENYNVFKIYIIPERNSFFPDTCQAFCFFTFNKSTKGEFLEINPSCTTINDFKNESLKIDLKKIKQISESMPVIIEEKEGWGILEKISKHNRLRYFSSIYNLRGELDLTLDKKYITNRKTNFPLLRGNNINEYKFDLGELYVKDEFLQKLNGKRKYLNLERLACQQISNIHSKKRLKFTKIPPQVILGNSCNFLGIEHNLLDFADISLDYMLGLFNSLLLDWRFRITNSNNHVSNYEISELPIAIPSPDQKKRIESLVKGNRQEINVEYNAKLNLAVFELYQIKNNEVLYILDKYGDTELTRNIKLNLKNAL